MTYKSHLSSADLRPGLNFPYLNFLVNNKLNFIIFYIKRFNFAQYVAEDRLLISVYVKDVDRINYVILQKGFNNGP
jgi:hypothetical protein